MLVCTVGKKRCKLVDCSTLRIMPLMLTAFYQWYTDDGGAFEGLDASLL